MVELANGELTLCFDEARGEARVYPKSGGCFARRLGFEAREVRREGDGLRFAFGGAEGSVRLEGNAEVWRVWGEGDMRALRFPGALAAEAGDEYVYPIGEGYRVRASGDDFPLGERLRFFASMELSMNAFALLRGAACALTGLEKGFDAALCSGKRDGRLESEIEWLPSKGQWRYAREARTYYARGLSEACAEYRAWRERLGGVTTLREKAARTPALWRLRGAASFWIFDDNNMNRLYGRECPPERTPRSVSRIAGELREMGVARALFNSFEGETREDCELLKAMGYLVGKYDIYRDVIPETRKPVMLPYRVGRCKHWRAWPDDVRREADGSLATAWKLHGTDGKMYDQNAVCDIPALKLAMEDVPKDVAEVGYNARFVDVQACSVLAECYHPLHPMTREDAARYVSLQSRYLADIGLVSGVEVGGEAFLNAIHYTEGLMSCPNEFRPEDAGRNMNTLYYGEGVPEQTRKYMLNPERRTPLWELVYHDCCVNYWYWGDSSNCCPELMPVRDLWNALYAQPPLYSLSVSQWEALRPEIARSHKRATRTASLAFGERMTDFQRLANGVLRTRFANGLTVTANFTDEPYALEDGRTLAGRDYLAEGFDDGE